MSELTNVSPGQPAVRGRPFMKGNGGRKPGAKNRATLAAATLMEGDREAMVQKARELALGGDVQMLKFFLGRTLPRERLIAIDLPRAGDSTFDPAKALANVIAAVADGEITPSEGSALANLTGNYTHALDYTKLLAEIDELKAELKGLTGQLKGKK